jgi:hypothetical protein
LSLTVSRHAALHSPGSDLTLATALSSLAAAVVAVELPCYDLKPGTSARADVTFWACTPPVWRTAGFMSLAVCDALAVALFYTSMLLAPQYITGGEVALVMLLEVVLGPLWVHVRFGDVPSVWTVAGGAVLVATLAVHECVGQTKGRELFTSRACHTPSLPAASLPSGERTQQVQPQGEQEELVYHRLEGTVQINVM